MDKISEIQRCLDAKSFELSHIMGMLVDPERASMQNLQDPPEEFVESPFGLFQVPDLSMISERESTHSCGSDTLSCKLLF